jgi:DNA-binding NarL/FixJ family response regulator
MAAVARGSSNSEIAKELFIGAATVKTHISASSPSSACATVPRS